jgi:hypothetical protein
MQYYSDISSKQKREACISVRTVVISKLGHPISSFICVTLRNVVESRFDVIELRFPVTAFSVSVHSALM